ncbi:hypothetical protein Anas_05225, partial [Armadillidium nasatum]
SVWYEPTDIKKARKPWDLPGSNSILFTSPNLNEFNAIVKFLSKGKAKDVVHSSCEDESFVQRIVEESKNYLSNLKAIMISLGNKGFIVVRQYTKDEDSSIYSKPKKSTDYDDEMIGLYFQIGTNYSISSVSGAGDCLAAGFVAGMIQGKRVSECAFIGQSCATASLKSSEAVPNSLDPNFIYSAKPLPYKIISNLKI